MEKSKEEKKQDEINEVNIDKSRSSKKQKIAFLISLILLIATFVSVVKLGDFINKPKTLFNATVESVFNEFNSAMTTISNNKYYILFNKNTLSIKTDANVNLKALSDNKDDLLLEEKFKDTKFDITTEVDRKNSYINMNMNIKKGNDKLTDILYVKKDLESYLKIDKVLNEFYLLSDIDIDYSSFDANKNIVLSDIIKENLLSRIENEEFRTGVKELYVDNKKYDCKESTYIFNGDEIKLLLKDIIADIDKDASMKKYLSSLFRIDNKNLINKLNEKVDKLKLDKDSTVSFSAYTQKGNDQIISFVIKDTSKSVFSKITISKSSNYSLIDYQADEDTFTVEVKTKNDIKNVKYIDTKHKIELDIDNKNSGSVIIRDSKTDDEELKGKFTLDVSKKLDTVNLKFDVFFTSNMESKKNVGIKSISTISKIKEYKEVDLSNYDKKNVLKNEGAEKIYKDVLNIIKNS